LKTNEKKEMVRKDILSTILNSLPSSCNKKIILNYIKENCPFNLEGVKEIKNLENNLISIFNGLLYISKDKKRLKVQTNNYLEKYEGVLLNKEFEYIKDLTKSQFNCLIEINETKKIPNIQKVIIKSIINIPFIKKIIDGYINKNDQENNRKDIKKMNTTDVSKSNVKENNLNTEKEIEKSYAYTLERVGGKGSFVFTLTKKELAEKVRYFILNNDMFKDENVNIETYIFKNFFGGYDSNLSIYLEIKLSPIIIREIVNNIFFG